MKCPNCGKEVFDGQYKCHHCGAWIPAFKEEKPKKKEAKEK